MHQNIDLISLNTYLTQKTVECIYSTVLTSLTYTTLFLSEHSLLSDRVANKFALHLTDSYSRTDPLGDDWKSAPC